MRKTSIIPVLALGAVCALVSLRAASSDIVVYASDATNLHGNWALISNASAAGGQELTSIDNGWSTTSTALASPSDYFDLTFSAPAFTPYHVWLRLRATGDSKWNDSVWVQFADATDSSGAAAYRVGTSNGLLVNLEPCSNCGVSGWGWIDTGYWTGQSPIVQFAANGPHTMRVQIREDGVQIDQIVLSPSTYFSSAPGARANDSTIVPKPSAPAPPVTSTPFGGVAAPIPGTIQAANFDEGGEGVAYHDLTAGNAGGAYRSTDVDLAASAEGGYCVGWIGAGEWLNYTVSVASAGQYTAAMRVASSGPGGTFHLEVNGANISGSIGVPDTGGWQSWTTLPVAVALGAGTQIIRVVMDTVGPSGAVGNLAFMTFTASSLTPTPSSTPFLGVMSAIPGTIQAANFDNGGEGVAYHDASSGNAGGAYRATDVDLAASSEGGFTVGWISAGEWTNYGANVAQTAPYNLAVRVAAPNGGSRLHVTFSGNGASAAITVPATGGWQNWTTVSVPVSLAAGAQTMTVVADTEGFNLSWIQVTASSPPLPTVPLFSHVYVIVFENQEYSNIIGNPSAPYINSLASKYALGTAYSAITHPSLPNYMAMTGGQTVFTDDCVGCTTSALNLADGLERGNRTWRGYFESMPSPCGTADTTLYATKHNPFLHYDDIVSNVSRCQSHIVPFSNFAGDVSSGNVANFTWVTPNLCNDMHDCSIATGDAWLSNVVPQILNAPDFATSALFIVWDEGTTNVNGGGMVPLLVVSPLVSPGSRSTTPANHDDLLRTLEEVWGLPLLGQTSSAHALREYFPMR